MGISTSSRFHSSKATGNSKRVSNSEQSGFAFRQFPLTSFTNIPRVVATIDHTSGHQMVHLAQEKVTCLKFIPYNACWLLTGTLTWPEELAIPGALRTWDFSNKRRLPDDNTICMDLTDKEGEINVEKTIACEISPDMRTVACLMNTGEGKICLWKKTRDSHLSIADEISYQRCCGMTGLPVCCSFSPDSKKLVSVICTDFFTIRERNAIFLWDVKTFKLESKVWLKGNIFGGCATSSSFSPDGELIVVVSNGGSICLLNGKALCLQAITKVGHENNALWCFFDPLCKHEHLVVGHQNGYISSWGIQCYEKAINLCCLKKIKVIQSPVEISCMAWSYDTSWIAVGSTDGKIKLLNSQNFSTVTELNIFTNGETFDSSLGVTCMDFTNMSDCLAAGYTNGKVHVWQLPSNFSLQHLCRNVVIKLVQLADIERLPVSSRIKQYLQGPHFSLD